MAVVVYKTPGAKESGFDHIEPLRLEEAIAYAESAKKAYQRALSEHTLLPNALPWIAIPMAAATLGLSISGTSGDPITALGLMSATGLALGQWVQNKPREALYNVGFNTITCLLQSIAPLPLIDSLALERAFTGHDSLRARLGKLAENLERLKSQIANVEAQQMPAEAKKEEKPTEKAEPKKDEPKHTEKKEPEAEKPKEQKVKKEAKK